MPVHECGHTDCHHMCGETQNIQVGETTIPNGYGRQPRDIEHDELQFKYNKLYDQYLWVPITEKQPAVCPDSSRWIEILIDIPGGPDVEKFWWSKWSHLPKRTTHWRNIIVPTYEELGYKSEYT